MDDFKIDIIVPFHVVNDLLNASVRSVKASLNVNIRIIGVNDTGNIVSKEMVGLSDSDVLVFNLGKGYLDALATGVAHIESQFTGFQDSDDFTDPLRFFNQLTYLVEGNYDLVTGQLVKTNPVGESLQTRSVFGNLPASLTPSQKLIFGPHGADSTIVAKSSLIKDSWHLHKTFSSTFADYGWLLTVLPQISIGHCSKAIYYYRAHHSQMSRRAKDVSGWNHLREVWLQNFAHVIDSDKADINKLIENFEIYEKLSLALAFPAALPKMNRKERRLFVDIITEMPRLFSFKNKSDLRIFRTLLARRGFFLTRGRVLKYWPQVVPIVYSLTISIIKGVRPRFNRSV